MSFDYSNLRGKIKTVCKTQDEFAKRIGMGRVVLSQRLNNKSDFDAKEIDRSCDVLGIEKSEIPAYFFTKEVQKHEHKP